MTTAEQTEFHERRHCSDEQCDKARTKWVEETLWPKMRIQIATMIGATVIFCAGIFIYLSNNAITAYDLAARDRYLTLQQHQQDINRIEGKIVALESSVAEHLTDVRKAIDRNLAAIQSIGRR